MSAPVFLVTGGSRGIGAAIGKAAGEAGYTVVLTYVSNPDEAEQVAARIRAEGGQAQAIRADTGEPADVETLFAAVDAAGTLAVMVYNGGITGPASRLEAADPATLSKVVGVNLVGAMLCARAAIPRMSTRQGGAGGAIIFMSSRASVYGSPDECVWYAASKGGIDSLTLGLSRELGLDGIRVNAVSPGPIDTGMLGEEKKRMALALSPVGRIGTPEEAAAAVMFLASAEASFVTGANLAVSGGR
ncbi:SDR family NAD(P)-dependent oxidoreductase [Sphingobium nicotianae]|uniref:SDR family oxidoreductase n=1 Tax=Sphingobium nicotianae TaxID=2782607 RepID=A0A9X1IRT3_9SPHN|nr:SDR family oxidoreductase [Sphingobium nicotianae]MBT2187470.1 SDR family oxidoreductase [Sphingobium nicotianae]